MMVHRGASKVILACRNLEKANAAAKDIQTTTSSSSDTVQVWHLDLSLYASVQAFADKVKTELPRLDVLIANAGLGTRRFRMTEDNEESIITNVVSMALFAFLLHPKLRETAAKYKTKTHLTVTGSGLYEVASFKERKAPVGQLFATLNDKSKAKMSDRYSVSKLLGMFVVKQLAAMSPVESGGVIVNIVAPGLCYSDLHRDFDNILGHILLKISARPTEVGARTLVYGASTGPESHGQYLPDCKITPTGGLTKGKEGVELQQRFWLELKAKLEAIRPGVTSLA